MLTLEEVVDAFDTWRASRESKNEPIPERLWTLTKALVPFYKKSQIQRALKLSGRQFSYHCKTSSAQNFHNLKDGDGFAAATLKPEPPIHDEACEFVLSGQHKRLQIKTNIHNMPYILSLVERHL